jgi:hypothetical protein
VSLCGNCMCDLYRALAVLCNFIMPALDHFSILMTEYGFLDDTRVDGPLNFFNESEFLTELAFRGALPLQTHLSPAIRSLTQGRRPRCTFLSCLSAAPNLEYLALLDSVPHTFDQKTRPIVMLHALIGSKATYSTMCSAPSSSSSILSSHPSTTPSSSSC